MVMTKDVCQVALATSRRRGLAHKRLPRRPFDLFVDRLTVGGMKAKLVTRSTYPHSHLYEIGRLRRVQARLRQVRQQSS